MLLSLMSVKLPSSSNNMPSVYLSNDRYCSHQPDFGLPPFFLWLDSNFCVSCKRPAASNKILRIQNEQLIHQILIKTLQIIIMLVSATKLSTDNYTRPRNNSPPRVLEHGRSNKQLSTQCMSPGIRTLDFPL